MLTTEEGSSTPTAAEHLLSGAADHCKQWAALPELQTTEEGALLSHRC
jgi:hypothetical protein